MENTKEQLITNIKEWIKLDTEITSLKKEIKEKTKSKNSLTTNLVTVMKTNKIDCFDINGGGLVYKTNKSKKPLNKTTLLNALNDYYKNDQQNIEELTTHLLNSREVVVKEIIKRKIEKQ